MKRRFFQIHLLTALVAMFVVAGFMWANLDVSHVEILYLDGISENNQAHVSCKRISYMGWPLEAVYSSPPDEVMSFAAMRSLSRWLARSPDPASEWQVYPSVSVDRLEKIDPGSKLAGKVVLTLDDVRRVDPSMEQNIVRESPLLPTWSANFYWKGIAINAVVALVATFAVMFGLEWFLRRRERAKI